MNHALIHALATDRREELLREAADRRLVRSVTRSTPGRPPWRRTRRHAPVDGASDLIA